MLVPNGGIFGNDPPPEDDDKDIMEEDVDGRAEEDKADEAGGPME